MPVLFFFFWMALFVSTSVNLSTGPTSVADLTTWCWRQPECTIDQKMMCELCACMCQWLPRTEDCYHILMMAELLGPGLFKIAFVTTNRSPPRGLGPNDDSWWKHLDDVNFILIMPINGTNLGQYDQPWSHLKQRSRACCERANELLRQWVIIFEIDACFGTTLCVFQILSGIETEKWFCQWITTSSMLAVGRMFPFRIRPLCPRLDNNGLVWNFETMNVPLNSFTYMSIGMIQLSANSKRQTDHHEVWLCCASLSQLRIDVENNGVTWGFVLKCLHCKGDCDLWPCSYEKYQYIS